jgi:hypothetical protein
MLTDTGIRNAKTSDRPRKLTDEKGLHLLVTPAGGKFWRMQYRFGGKQKLLSFGAYPETGLAAAREQREEARKLLANGIDPGADKKARKAARQEREMNTFEAVARNWFEKWETGVTSSTAKSQWERLVKHIMPVLGQMPIANIDAPTVLASLRPLEDRGTGDTLRKTKMAISQIMDFAIQHGQARHNPIPSFKGACCIPDD